MNSITLENIEEFSVPLDEHLGRWMFEDAEKNIIIEHKDQIIALNRAASKVLWDLEMQFNIFGKEFFEGTFFRENLEWKAVGKTDAEIRKWLYNLGIPFDNKVFVSLQPDWGFVMTWKMVIKNFDGLFRANDQSVWDRTLNWGLAYDHNEIFHFGKNRIYDAHVEYEKLAIRNNILKEVNERIERNRNNTGGVFPRSSEK